MLGSYGINSEIEPGLTVEEQEYWDKIRPLVQSDPDTALGYLEQLAAPEDSSALFDFTIGNIHSQNKRNEEAAKAFVGAVEKFPAYRRAHRNLAIVYVQNGRPKDAIRHFTRAIELGANDGLTYGLLGAAYIETEDSVPAETAFRNALLLNPDIDDWKFGLARSLLAQERFREVAALVEKMIVENPGEEKLWLLQADAFIGNKEMLQAAANFEILNRMGKADPETMTTLGHIYANEGLLGLAADAYLKAFERQENREIGDTLKAAEILLDRDGLDDTERLLGELKAMVGEDLSRENQIQILRLEARVGLAKGAGEGAARLLEDVVDLDPLDGDSLIKLGEYYGRNKEYEKAYFKLERAANVEKFEADAKVRHAQFLVEQGKYREAIPLLRRAQEIKPRENVARYLEELERYTRTR